MLSINVPNVDPLYLYAFLTYYEVKRESMNLTRGPTKKGPYRIGDDNLLNLIKSSFSEFKAWQLETGKTLNDFLNRQIIPVAVNNGLAQVDLTEIENYPIFIAKHPTHKNCYQYGPFSVWSNHPIKMPLNYILRMNNLPLVNNIEFDSCPPHIQLVKVENGIAFTDGETVGHLSGSVIIGKSESDYYWISNPEIIQRRFYCTNLPGVCDVFFQTRQQKDRHMSICSSESKIVSQQVETLIRCKVNLENYLRFHMVKTLTC